jgi:hypothetical protein
MTRSQLWPVTMSEWSGEGEEEEVWNLSVSWMTYLPMKLEAPKMMTWNPSGFEGDITSQRCYR